MKKALKVVLLSVPVALIWYMRGALVPAVDAKNLMVRGVLTIASVILAILFLSDAKFRTETVAKVRAFWHNPLGKALVASYAVLIVSTMLAYSKYTAFFGTAARGEGFVGLSFFYFLSFITAVVFEKKDWLNFWKVTAIAGTIVFLKELIEFIGGAYRPGSLMDNPIFLAGYFLIIIYAGFILYKEGKEVRNKALVRWGVLTAIMSVVGIFITQSRGVMLGMIVGVGASLVYLAFKSTAEGSGGKVLRKTAVGILVGLMVLGSGFVATRHARVWTHVPGFSRIAEFSITDPTTLSRIENAKLTLRAVRPSGANIKNTLVGWGWDNYVFAWQANYDPKLYQYDRGIFDRAHNKLLDVLVMNGVLGLIAYLAIWFYIVRAAFYIGKKSVIGCTAVLFFSTAFFVQNLFVFDTSISYVPFFSLIGYMVFETRQKYER
jgi:O-antigen ligase